MQVVQVQTQVVVVGLGPVGAALSNLLGRQGIQVLVIDQATTVFAAPRAIALDNEALRILQMCGVAEGEFDTVAIPQIRMHSPVFGQFGQANSCGPLDGHPKLVTFFQPELEAVLRAKLTAHPKVQIRLGVELVSFTQDNDGVLAHLKSLDGAMFRVRADYIVGADGANSMVRRQIGSEFNGHTFPEDWLVVDAKKVPNPIDHVEFVCNHRRPVPHMVAPGDRQRWEFKLSRHETRAEMEKPETIRALLAPWAKADEIEIERVAVYRFHARVADRFSSGRAFLVGDAAHITPPFIGQGLVAGLRDVGNLGWKLAWVLKDRAAASILESYHQERRPHVVAMVRLATVMGRLVMPGNAVSAFVVHGLMSCLRLVPRLRRLFEELEVKPAHLFRHGLFVTDREPSRLQRGGLLAQGWVRAGLGAPPVMSDDVLGGALVAIGFGVDPQRHLASDLRSAWLAAGGSFVQIDPRGPSCVASDSDRWEDITGVLIPSYAPMGWVAIARPDHTVMHDGPAESVSRLISDSLGALSAPQRAAQHSPIDDRQPTKV